MFKKTIFWGLTTAISFCSGCTIYTPLFMTTDEKAQSLNLVNSEWDDFSGRLEKGKVYRYSNRGFDKDLRFTVLQKLSETSILVIRSRAIDSSFDEICKLCVFHITSPANYADGAALREGEYVCIGTYEYTTREEVPKSVYSLVEKEFYEEHIDDFGK